MPDSEIQRSLGRLEAKVDALTDLTRSQSRTNAEALNRVAALERGQTWAIGAFAGGSLVVSILAAVVWRAVGLVLSIPGVSP